MKPIARLKQYIDFKGISLNSFDKSIGASNGYIGKQIKNDGSIGTDVLQKITSIYTDLDLNWLITGSGSMTSGNDNYKKNDENQNHIVSEDSANYISMSCKEQIKQLNKTISILHEQIMEANKDKETYRTLLLDKK